MYVVLFEQLNNSLVLGTNKIEITAAVIVLMKENVENFDLLNFLVLDKNYSQVKSYQNIRKHKLIGLTGFNLP